MAKGTGDHGLLTSESWNQWILNPLRFYLEYDPNGYRVDLRGTDDMSTVENVSRNHWATMECMSGLINAFNDILTLRLAILKREKHVEIIRAKEREARRSMSRRELSA